MQTEPYEIWEGLDRKSEEYQKLKEERSQVLHLASLSCCKYLLHPRSALAAPSAAPPALCHD